MKALFFDPATSTGWGLFEIEQRKGMLTGILTDFGFLTTKEKVDGKRYLELKEKAEALLAKAGKIGVIGIEDYMFSSRKRNGANLNSGYRAILHLLAAEHKIDEVFTVNITNWKRFIAGSSRPSKEQKKKYGNKANKLYIQDAVEDKFGITFPEFIYNSDTDRMVQFKSDVVDAICIGIYTLTEECKVEDFDFEIFNKRKG